MLFSLCCLAQESDRVALVGTRHPARINPLYPFTIVAGSLLTVVGKTFGQLDPAGESLHWRSTLCNEIT